MIERVHIDNYRTFVNCDIRLNPVSLLLGPNGSGKSALFDLAQSLKRFVSGVGFASDFFPGTELTRWQSLDEQTFELDVRTEHGLCRYTLKLTHTKDRRKCRVQSETLTLDRKPLFSFVDGVIQLFNDRHDKGPAMSFDWNRSGLSAIHTRHDNTKLTAFREVLANILFLRSCPPVMEGDSKEEEEELDTSGNNFPSWYRFVSRQDISQQLELFTELRGVIDGFESLRLEGPADSTATLRALIKPAGSDKALSYKFEELSDGQRQLVVLHAILFGVSNPKRILFLDEPDNYLALREIEPWLTALMDAAGRSIAQAIVISHHPEVIDHLARERGIWFARESGGKTRVDVGRADDPAPLKPSDIEARGW